MIFCPGCKIEMHCVQNAVAVVFGESHVYMGDMFQCAICGKHTVRTTLEPIHFPDVRTKAKRFIEAKE